MTFTNWKSAFVCCAVIPLLCAGAFIVTDLAMRGKGETRLDKIERRFEALECPYESAS